MSQFTTGRSEESRSLRLRVPSLYDKVLLGMEENELHPKLSFEVLLIGVSSGTTYIKNFVVG